MVQFQGTLHSAGYTLAHQLNTVSRIIFADEQEAPKVIQQDLTWLNKHCSSDMLNEDSQEEDNLESNPDGKVEVVSKNSQKKV